MSDNWVVSTLEDALSNWNDKLAEIWSLVSQTPESFRGGEIWTVIVSIHNALVGFGYGLLVLFFAMGVFRSAASFRELQRPEFALRHFIRFLLAKVAVGSSLELINGIYKICGGVVSTVMGGIGSAISTTATLPDKIVEAIEDVSFLESIPLWLVSLLGSLLITILSYVLILTVYGRFFKSSFTPRLHPCRWHHSREKLRPEPVRHSSKAMSGCAWRARSLCCPA